MRASPQEPQKPRPTTINTNMQIIMTIMLLLSITTSVNAQTDEETLSPSPTPQLTPTDGCCASCIGKTSNIPYTYDPVVHTQCSAVHGICCYNCGQDSATQPDVLDATFGDDGVTPEVEAGGWFQVAWTNVVRVTYEYYRVNQNKTTTVRNGSTEARTLDGNFLICAKAQGAIYIRGWGEDSCLSATPEFKIAIVGGTDVENCGAKIPSVSTEGSSSTSSTSSSSPSTSSSSLPSASSTSSLSTGAATASQLAGASIQESLDSCNLQRASIVIATDGTKQCVCAAEWSGPPDCSGYPWWKIAAAAGGAVAAALSIIVSVRAFINSRKQNKEKEKGSRRSHGDDPMLGEDSIFIADFTRRNISAKSGSSNHSNPPNQTVERREYTL